MCYTLLYKCAHATLARKCNIELSAVSRWKRDKSKLEETIEASNLKHDKKSIFCIEGRGQKPLSVGMEDFIWSSPQINLQMHSTFRIS